MLRHGRGPLLGGVILLLLTACSGGASGTIRGTVRVADVSVGGATVALGPVEEDAEADESTELAEATSGDDGTYTFGELEDGEYIVHVDVDIPNIGNCRILATVSVEDAGTVTANLEVPAGYQPTGPLSLLFDGNILSC